MCDYSLQAVQSRPAVVGDRLVTHNFGTGTTGFRALGEPSAVAVCLLPGTELSFESRPLRLGENHWQEGVGKPLSNVATFRQINKQHERVHHDALEFSPQGEEFSPQGETVLLTTSARASAPPSCSSRQHPKQTPSARSSAAPSSPANGLPVRRHVPAGSATAAHQPHWPRASAPRRHQGHAQPRLQHEADRKAFRLELRSRALPARDHRPPQRGERDTIGTTHTQMGHGTRRVGSERS